MEGPRAQYELLTSSWGSTWRSASKPRLWILTSRVSGVSNTGRSFLPLRSSGTSCSVAVWAVQYRYGEKKLLHAFEWGTVNMAAISCSKGLRAMSSVGKECTGRNGRKWLTMTLPHSSLCPLASRLRRTRFFFLFCCCRVLAASFPLSSRVSRDSLNSALTSVVACKPGSGQNVTAASVRTRQQLNLGVFSGATWGGFGGSAPCFHNNDNPPELSMVESTH